MRKQTKSKYMRDEMFAELEGAFKEALAHVRGVRPDLRTTKIALPPRPHKMPHERIVRLRKRLNCSQSIFARLINVSPKTVQAWEQGLREPSDAALKLLVIAEKHPNVLLDSY